MSQEDLDHLEEVLTEIAHSTVSSQMEESEVIRRARKYMRQQKRLNGCLSQPLDMNTATLSEIHRYTNPRPVTEDVMKAMLIILGEHPNDVEVGSRVSLSYTCTLYQISLSLLFLLYMYVYVHV